MSSSSTFDVARVRQNWNRSAGSPPRGTSDRLAEARVPGDLHKEAAELLDEIERELVRQLPTERALLAPFVTRLRKHVKEAADKRGQKSDGAGGDDESGHEQIQSDVQALTDVCEALLRVKR